MDLQHDAKGIQEERNSFDPNGQELPDWLSYSRYLTTIDGEVVETGTVVQLPQTYFGPSIPLGDGWVYGGSTIPVTTSISPPNPTFTSTSVIETATQPLSLSTIRSAPTQTASVSSSADFQSTGSASGDPSRSSLASLSNTTPSQSASTRSSSLGLTRSSSTPVSSSSASSTPISATSTVGTIPIPSPVPIPLPPSTPPTPSSSRSNLLPLLPALLVPLLAIILILLIAICLFNRRSIRRKEGYKATLQATSGGYGGWLTSSFYRSKSGRYRSVWVNNLSTEDKNRSRPTSMLSPTFLGGQALNAVKSPNEKSALLPDFIAQHHRSSSVSEDLDDELKDLVRTNQSLLQRLGIGWGRLTPSPTPESSGAGARIISGNTIEKFVGLAVTPSRPGTPGRIPPSSPTRSNSTTTGMAARSSSSSKRLSNDPPPRNHKRSETTGTTESSSHRDETPLREADLFYKPPVPTVSSRGSSGSKGSHNTRGSPSHRGVASNRDRPLPPLPGETGFSVGIPETPQTVHTSLMEGDISEYGGYRDKKARYRAGGDRLEFPIPPSHERLTMGEEGGTFGTRHNKIADIEDDFRHSYISGESLYHTPGIDVLEPLESSTLLSHPTTPKKPAPALGSILIARQDSGYHHVPLSPFGTHTPSRSGSPEKSSSETHVSQPGHISSTTPSREGQKIRPLPDIPRLLAGSPPNRPPKSPARQTFLFTPPSREAIGDLFSSSPSPRSSMTRSRDIGGSGSSTKEFLGLPTLGGSLARILTGARGEREDRAFGEFGEPLKASSASGISPMITEPSPSILEESSQIGSIHTSQSRSQESPVSATSTSRRQNLEASGQQALRGRRSQPRLVDTRDLSLISTTGGEDPGGEVKSVREDKKDSGWIGRWRGG